MEAEQGMHSQNSPIIARPPSEWRAVYVTLISYIRVRLIHTEQDKHLNPTNESSYRVLFRRNMSFIRGCVKLTSPFLDMLVTRSLWSNMCKSIFSIASRADSSMCACGGENAFLAEWYHSNVKYRPGWWALATTETTTSRCVRLTSRKTSDAIRLRSRWTTVYSNQRDSPRKWHASSS